VAGYQPFEQHPERGQVLFHRGRREFRLQVLHEGGDVDGLHVGQLADAAPVAPARKAADGVRVRLARAVVVDLGP
jgi:hypothetical protein